MSCHKPSILNSVLAPAQRQSVRNTKDARHTKKLSNLSLELVMRSRRVGMTFLVSCNACRCTDDVVG